MSDDSRRKEPNSLDSCTSTVGGTDVERSDVDIEAELQHLSIELDSSSHLPVKMKQIETYLSFAADPLESHQ